MRKIEITEKELEIIKRYKKASEELREAEREVRELKMTLADDDSVELLFNGKVVGKILIVDVKRIDINLLPPEIKEAYTRIDKDRRLIVIGIPIDPQ